MAIRLVFLLSLLFLLFFSTGCLPEETVETDPPEGWESDSTRWWRTGFDTTGIFRDLETLASMQVTGSEVTYIASANIARQRANQRQWFEHAVKRSIIQFYRNQPEIVDSLFERHVTPMLQEVDMTANMESQVEQFKRKSYQFLHKNYFQAPQTQYQIGRDFEVPYPEALRKQQIAGEVFTQIYVDEAGEPLAIELLDSADSQLDGIAMRAMTKMRWRPAYLMRKGRWVPIPSWTRFSIKFGGS